MQTYSSVEDLPPLGSPPPGGRYQLYGRRELPAFAHEFGLSDAWLHETLVTDLVFKVRWNEHFWRMMCKAVQEGRELTRDPFFLQCMPRPGTLGPEDFQFVEALMQRRASRQEIEAAVASMRTRLATHPSDQLKYLPTLDGRRLDCEHKYPSTLMVFGVKWQQCYVFCPNCMRTINWNRGEPGTRIAEREPERVRRYIELHPEITDVVLTGGDLSFAMTDEIAEWVTALLGVGSWTNLRVATKAFTHWPWRFTTDRDAPDLLELFKRVIATGRTVSVMAHVSHWAELDHPMVREAVGRLLELGVQLYAQAPIVPELNDDPAVLRRTIVDGVDLGFTEYYRFQPREVVTDKFLLPLAYTLRVYQEAISGLAGRYKTGHGIVASAEAGKLHFTGTTDVRLPDGGIQKCFVVQHQQAPNPSAVGTIYLARYSETATWPSQLEPLYAGAFDWRE